jgi:hypothetical protein
MWLLQGARVRAGHQGLERLAIFSGFRAENFLIAAGGPVVSRCLPASKPLPRQPQLEQILVGDTGIEPVTSSV